MTSKDFYYEFEARFRGNRAEIMGRLEAYRPFVAPFLAGDTKPKVIDLGCGRGEWLELMGSIGFEAHGVDLDEGMLQDCFDRGLSAVNADAIESLKALPAASHAVVSGFHIAEHLPFEVLQTLIAEAFRVLIPGGLLILETPNAENINVGTLTFHMDPTHVKPIPPGLLSFLPRYHGFGRVLVVRLQENRALAQSDHVGLMDVFQGVSPDYAIVAQKAGDADILAAFDAAFEGQYGLTLDTLANRFESGFVTTMAHEELQRDLWSVHRHIDQIEDRMREQAAEAAERAEVHAAQAAAQIADYQGQLIAFQTSTSWQITRPLRVLVRLVRNPRQAAPVLTSRVREAARGGIAGLIRFVLARPVLRKTAHRVLARFPQQTRRLKSMLVPKEAGNYTSDFVHQVSEQNLTPKARQIYKELKDRLEH